MSRATQDALLKQLKDPFDPKFVKWRVGATNADKTKGIALAYIDSREVMKRFDDVCGVAGWQDRVQAIDKGFICEIDVWLDDRWITKANAAGQTAIEPIKGGASDALKRTAAVWGVGRYLYYLPNIWVKIKQTGTTRDGKPVYSLAEVPELPQWALPNSGIERWEDVMEMEAEVDSGADSEAVGAIVETVDTLLEVKTEAELDTVLDTVPVDQQLILANQINAKRRELRHAAKIDSNNS